MEIIKSLPPVLDGNTECAVDIEIFGMDAKRLHRPTGWFASMQVAVGDDVYIVLDEKDLQEAWDRIKDAKTIIGHNILFDLRHLRRWIKIDKRFVWCTYLMERVLFGGYYAGGEYSLSDLVRRYLDVKLEKDTRAEFGTADHMTESMIQYAALDAYYTLKVKQAQDAEIEKRHYDNRTYIEIDEPNIWAVLDMKPIKVNTKRWLEMAVEFEQKGRELEGELGINVNSHVQVKAYILKTLRKTIDNTEAQTLENLQSEVADKILLARQYRKATSTYGEKWIENNVEADGMVYSDYQVSGSETGRSTSSSPNLSQIPSRKIPEYRKLFVSSKGKLILADIQAQEPRCLAYLSGDKVLRKVFDDKQDIHLSVARAVFQDDTITKSDPRRDIGKVINLATSYGMTAKGLSQRLRISEDEAEQFLSNYFTKFFGVRMYIDRQRDIARRREYVESITGRRVWINPYFFGWENNACNAPIQSSAADFTKMWMNKLWEQCQARHLDYPVTMAIYDELVLDVPTEDLSMYKELLTESFNATADYLFKGMPFEVEIHSGNTWFAKKEDE